MLVSIGRPSGTAQTMMVTATVTASMISLIQLERASAWNSALATVPLKMLMPMTAYSVPMSIDEALAGFTPTAGDVITSQTDGSVTYLNGRWRGTLTTLVPGKGYMYKSVDGTTRSFVFGGAEYDPSALPEEYLEVKIEKISPNLPDRRRLSFRMVTGKV